MEPNKTLTLFDIFSISDREGQMRPIFHEGIVQEAVIDKEKKTLKTSIKLPCICAPAFIEKAQEMIKTKYELSKVIIEPKYPESLLGDEYFKGLIDRIIIDHPAARGYLSDATVAFDGKTLLFSLPMGGQEFLKPCAADIKRWIFEEFNLSVAVEFVTDAAEAEKKRIEMESLHAKIAEENAKAAAEAAAQQAAKPSAPRERKPEQRDFRAARLKKVENDVVFGKPQIGEIVRIEDIADDEFGKVTIEGDVFAVDHKEIPARDFWRLSFDITDYTGSVRVNKIASQDEAKEIMDAVKTGKHVIVHGSMTYDRYAQDTVLKAQNMLLGKKKERSDKSENKRVELHMHTNMSAMDGMSSTEDLIERAAKWGHKAIAITDHGVVQAYPDAMNSAKKHEIKIIYGVEAYFVNNQASVRALTGKSDKRLEDDIICFDIETTGLNNKTEEITEIAATVLRNGELAETFHTYVNPQKHIPEKITQLTGISDATVKDAPTIDIALRDFLDFVGNRVLAAHNAEFDIGFLKVACDRLGIDYDFVYLDSLAMARALMPNLDKHKLNIVAAALKLPSFQHHRAADDAATVAYMLARFFEMLKEKCNTTSLSEVNLDLTGLTPEGTMPAKTRPYHMIILVKNYTGLKNLYKLVSLAHLKYFKKRPIIPRSVLDEYREGLIIGSACEAGELYNAVVAGRPEEELLEIAKYYDYLEIQPLGNNAFMIPKGIVSSMEDIRDFNRTIVRLADKLNLPVVATGDVHFLDPHDEVYRRVLMAGQGFSDADNQAPLYLKTTDEMLEEFSYLGEDVAYKAVVENTNMIADLCDEILPIPKEQYPPSIEGSKEELISMCHNRVHELYGDDLPPVVKERMDYELDKITTHGFDVMYMIAQKLVYRSNQDGYLVGSRGSVGSSFVAFLSGITEVNALPPHYRCPNCKNTVFMENMGFGAGVDMEDRVCEKCGTQYLKDGFDIPFATFLGFDGDKAPDIDLNFSGEYQSKAHKQTIEIFGEGHVFRAGTISAVMDRTAYGYAKKYLEERGMTVSKAEENRLAVGCTGIKRTTGQHPGGVMIVPREKEIYDFTPVQHPADDQTTDIITTHFDYHSIHDNLLKLDLLGHDDPTMIRMLENLTGVDAKKIPLDDPETMSIFTSIKALGIDEDPLLGVTGSVAIPEFGTKFVREMLIDTQPKTFDELVRISGLSHGTDVWLDNAQTLVQNKIATLKQVICARDDIMLYLISKGVQPKLSFTIMESVRKGKGLKPEWEDEMRAHDVPEWYIDSCKKIKYMFPKAHAVAYVMMAFRIAWFKVHQPKAFYSAYFSIRAKGFDASVMTRGDNVVVSKIEELSHREKISAAEKDMLVTLEVCHEFYRRGFKFEDIDLYKSDAVDFIITDDGLLPPFTSIPGLGEVAARSIMEQRKIRKFLSVEEIQSRCAKVSKAVVELLDENGALGNIPKSSQMSLF